MSDVTKSFKHPKTGNIVCCKGRVLWNHLSTGKPDKEKPKDEWQYELVLLFKKGSDLDECKASVDEAARDEFPKLFKESKDKWPKVLITPFKRTADYDKLASALEASDMDPAEWPVYFAMKAYADKKPQIVGPNGRADGVDEAQVYPGRWARATFWAKAYSHVSGTKGVRLNLVNVQLLDNDDEIALGSGRVAAETEFDAVEGAGDDSKSSDNLFD